MDLKLPKYKLLTEVFYADFVSLTLQKSKIIGTMLQPKGNPPVYQLENGVALDEDNLYINTAEAKEKLIKLFDVFKENLNEQ